jgi:hypothetical protein
MNTFPAPYPRFMLFRYFIHWFVQNFGIMLYIIVVGGSVTALLFYTFIVSIKKNQWDSAVMIFIFTIIVMGAIVGTGYDVVAGIDITSLK